MEPTGNSRRTLLRRLAIVLVLLAPLAAALWMGSARWAEDRVLAAAQQRLESGQWEAALDALAPLQGRRALSREARRRAAEVYFRLGEDRKAHELLVGVPYREDSADDRRLRDLAARNQRAAKLLEQADRSRDPRKRLQLARQAREQLPEAPPILQRVIQEELMVMSRGASAEVSEEFSRDYTDLRAHAPRAADELKRRLAELLARHPETETR